VKWVPLVALPNLRMEGNVECNYAAIVGPADARIDSLRKEIPRFDLFFSKFHDQFQNQIYSSFLIIKDDAIGKCNTAEAVSAFRDIYVSSTVPFARTSILRFEKSAQFAFSAAFQFYPWMIDRKYEDVLLSNSAELHVHSLDIFEGQSFPKRGQASLLLSDIDVPLAQKLLSHWIERYFNGSIVWKDKAVFRSLNMANEASRIPALTVTTIYDIGRSLALWVSACEILAHPGEGGEVNFWKVAEILESIKWCSAKLKSVSHDRKGKKVKLATWIYGKVYDLRNDYLHGNEVKSDALVLNNKAITNFAACLHRLLLAAVLEIDPEAEIEEPSSTYDEYLAKHMKSDKFHIAFEEALLTAVKI
jgi:hypothetical protein